MDLLVKEEEEFKEAEISGSEDELQDIDDRKTNKLIDSVLALNKKSAKYTQRTNQAKEITEFNFGSSESSGRIHVGELLQSLVKAQKNKKIRKQLKRIKNTDLLENPLPKLEQEKLDRTIAYKKVSEEVSVWNSTVWQNRKKEHQEFPLQTEKIEVFNNQTFCQRFVARNPLELELQSLLYKQDSNTERRNKELTTAEVKVLKALDLKEAKKRRNELMKYKALLNYQELKAKWKGKIKSKNYRRRLKKDRLEKEKMNINDLADKDPKKFEERMKMVEKSRVKERASLKHRGGSKFQKKQMMYAKYDPNTQERIAAMVNKNKELTQKPVELSEESDDSHDDDNEEDKQEQKTLSRSMVGSSNSWMQQNPLVSKRAAQIQNFSETVPVNKDKLSAAEKEINCSKAKKPCLSVLRNDEIKLDSKTEEEVDNFELITEEVMPTSLRKPMPGRQKVETLPVSTDDLHIDAEQVLSTKTNISTEIPMLLVNEEESDDDDDDMNGRLALSQAFADDDVVQAFNEEKEKTIDAENPTDINLALPGWGSWCGNGLSVPKHKQKKFTIKAGSTNRKDSRLGHVIINEKNDKVISEYQVKTIPFPFSDVENFNKSLKTPIGKEWNPQTAFNKLTQPRVTTKSGTIIRPISRSVLLKKKKDNF